MITLIGLGNPGKAYERTRHNVGFMLLDALAARWGKVFRQEPALEAEVFRIDLAGLDCWVLKPQTYMNRSGRSLRFLSQALDLKTERSLVVFDEVQLPLGRFKFSFGGSAGGHNGVSSLIAEGGSEGFKRLRLGVGPYTRETELKDFVLSRFREEEEELLKETLGVGVQAIDSWLFQKKGSEEGYSQTMNHYNSRGTQPLFLKQLEEQESTDSQAGDQVE